MNNKFQLCIHKFTTKYISQIQDLSSTLSSQHSAQQAYQTQEDKSKEREYRVVTSNAQSRPMKPHDSRDGAEEALPPPEEPNLIPEQLASCTSV